MQGLCLSETPCLEKKFILGDRDTEGGRMIPEAQAKLQTQTGGLRPHQPLTTFHVKMVVTTAPRSNATSFGRSIRLQS